MRATARTGPDTLGRIRTRGERMVISDCAVVLAICILDAKIGLKN